MAKKTAAKTENDLNLKQEQFCQSYVNGGRDLFGNGTQCYLEVYGEDFISENGKPMSYQTAMVNASRLLSNAKIIKRVNELLEEGGFNDQNVDKQHLFLINQHADLKTKLGAIREYNALKKRVENKLTLTITPSEEELRRATEAVNKFLSNDNNTGNSTI